MTEQTTKTNTSPSGEDEITALRKHIAWAADAYNRVQDDANQLEETIYAMLDQVPYHTLIDYMEARADREEKL